MSDYILKKCEVSSTDFKVTKSDLSFYKKKNLPLPRLSPNERLKRRLSFRNERNLYHRECDSCQKKIISIYSSDKTYPVYCADCWWSDSWSAEDHSRDFDFSRPFFPQFKELLTSVPRLYMYAVNNQNSDYTNGTVGNKDCYLIFASDHNEDTHYSYSVYNCTSCFDMMSSKECELCYQCIGCEKCYDLRFSENCISSHSSQFLYNCNGCSDCTLSTNLRNKRYYFLNQPYSKEEYYKKVEELSLNKRSGVEKGRILYEEIKKKAVKPHYIGNKNENVTGDYIFNSKNSHHCFDSHSLEDCKFVTHGNKVKDCYDAYVIVDNSECCLENLSAISLFDCNFTMNVWYGNNIWYSDSCVNSNNLFGCVGLRKKNNYILNQKYSDAEYARTFKKVISHMKETEELGEFFPASISLFNRDETLAKGLNKKASVSSERTKGETPPDDIKDVDDEILKKRFHCNYENKEFRLTRQELEFYRKMNLPPPSLSHEARHKMRLSAKSGVELITIQCLECEKVLSSTRNEAYCKACYAEGVL